MNSPHGIFYLLKRTLCVYLYFPDIIKPIVMGWLYETVLHFPLFFNEIMSKLSQSAVDHDSNHFCFIKAYSLFLKSALS